MSDAHAHPAIAALLGQYDKTRSPALLQEASDAISQEDGAAPADPAEAPHIGEHRIALWLDLLARFKRDIDPAFDPDHAPTQSVMPPEINGMQLPPGVAPSAISDPALRRQYEHDIATNKTRIGQFTVQNKLHEIHAAVLDRASASIAGIHEKLGLSPEEIKTALAKGDILPADRDTLIKALSP